MDPQYAHSTAEKKLALSSSRDTESPLAGTFDLQGQMFLVLQIYVR